MEKSPSGAPIHRHQPRKRKFEFAPGNSDNIDKITAHIEHHLGNPATVYHEIVSDLVHLDVHIITPTKDRNFYTLITTGMSDQPMQAPAPAADCQYSELMICLPPTWPMDQKDWQNEDHYWPIRLLKSTARMPHEYQTWIWAMHTIPNGDPAEPYAPSTSLTGVILLPPITVPDAFRELKIDDQKTIHFHALVPLHSDEMDLKLKKGAEALFAGFDKHHLSEVLNPTRPSTVTPKRSWFNFWKK